MPRPRKLQELTIVSSPPSVSPLGRLAVVEPITAEELVGEEWAEWYRMTPQERFAESMKLWDTFFALGGSLEPEADSQSPFFDEEEWRANSTDGGPGMRVLRRGPV
jgi:hypothetical protein